MKDATGNGVGIVRELAAKAPVPTVAAILVAGMIWFFLGAMREQVATFTTSLEKHDSLLGSALKEVERAVQANTSVLTNIDQREQRREERRQTRLEEKGG